MKWVLKSFPGPFPAPSSMVDTLENSYVKMRVLCGAGSVLQSESQKAGQSRKTKGGQRSHSIGALFTLSLPSLAVKVPYVLQPHNAATQAGTCGACLKSQ